MRRNQNITSHKQASLSFFPLQNKKIVCRLIDIYAINPIVALLRFIFKQED